MLIERNWGIFKFYKNYDYNQYCIMHLSIFLQVSESLLSPKNSQPPAQTQTPCRLPMRMLEPSSSERAAHTQPSASSTREIPRTPPPDLRPLSAARMPNRPSDRTPLLPLTLPVRQPQNPIPGEWVWPVVWWRLFNQGIQGVWEIMYFHHLWGVWVLTAFHHLWTT